MTEQGRVIPFQEQVLLNEDLPHRLISPQAFLSFQANGGKGWLDLETFQETPAQNWDQDRIQDHFRIFPNRAELHMGGQRIVTMGFDSSFLPRITLFKQGTAMSSLKAMSSVPSHDNENLTPL